MTSEDTKLAVMANNIEYIKRDIIEIRSRLEKDYVTRSEFDPVKRIVYGVVGIMGAAVIGTLMTILLR